MPGERPGLIVLGGVDRDPTDHPVWAFDPAVCGGLAPSETPTCWVCGCPRIDHDRRPDPDGDPDIETIRCLRCGYGDCVEIHRYDGTVREYPAPSIQSVGWDGDEARVAYAMRQLSEANARSGRHGRDLSFLLGRPK